MAARKALPAPTVVSNEIAAISLHVPIPALLHIYVLPFLFLYPAAAYVYLLRYDDLVVDQANTFIGCVVLFGSHALSWLATRWSCDFRALVTSLRVRDFIVPLDIASVRFILIPCSLSLASSDTLAHSDRPPLPLFAFFVNINVARSDYRWHHIGVRLSCRQATSEKHPW